MPVERSDPERLLEHTLGFARHEGDHHQFSLLIRGKIVAYTHTSHSPKVRTIDDSLLAKIARRDLHVSPQFLKALLAGTKMREDYLAELESRGLLPADR